MTSRLASLLVQEGLVSSKKMAEAFQRQVIYGGTLDTVLLEMDVLDESTLLDALGRASSLPTAGDLPSVEQLKTAGAAKWFPLELSERYHAVPIAVEGSVVRVLVIDPPDRKQLDELGYTLSRSLEPIIVPEHRFVHATSLVYDNTIPARFQSLQAKLLKRSISRPAPARVAAPTLAAPTLAAPTLAAPAASPAPAPVPAPVHEDNIASSRRTVVTDVPMPRPRAAGAPTAQILEEATPQLIPRNLNHLPVPLERLPDVGSSGPEATPLPLEEAVAQIDAADDRDAIFAALCRGARARVPFAAVLTIHGELAVGKMALSERWTDRDTVAGLSVSVDRSAPFRAAVNGLAPYLGRVGEDAVGAQALTALRRKPPMPALLLPIVLRGRTVALLYADCGGAPIAADMLADLNNAAAAAARAFQRLILRAKGGGYAQAAAPATAKLAPAAPVAPTAPAPAPNGDSWGAAPVVNDKPRITQPRFSTAMVEAINESVPAVLSDLPTEPIVHRDAMASPRPLDLDALLTSIARSDDQARSSVDSILQLGERGAESVVARLPGPLRLDRHTLRGAPPPLADHGPYLAVIARFGQRARGPLLRRIGDPSLEVRYYATLALGELGGPEAVVAIGSRLFDSDAGVRAVAIDALAHLPESVERRELIESLRGELPGPEAPRQRLAAEALGGLHDAPSVPRLIELVKHEDPQVVSSVRRALLVITKQDFGTSRWRWRGWWERHRAEPRVEWMLEGLGHSEAEVRLSAAEELKQLAPESFGYRFDLPRREREEARKRWIDWWRMHGKKSAPERR